MRPHVNIFHVTVKQEYWLSFSVFDYYRSVSSQPMEYFLLGFYGSMNKNIHLVFFTCYCMNCDLVYAGFDMYANHVNILKLFLYVEGKNQASRSEWGPFWINSLCNSATKQLGPRLRPTMMPPCPYYIQISAFPLPFLTFFCIIFLWKKKKNSWIKAIIRVEISCHISIIPSSIHIWNTCTFHSIYCTSTSSLDQPPFLINSSI